MEEQDDPLGILNTEDPLGILKKKGLASATVGPSSGVPAENSGTPSEKSSGTDDVRTVEGSYKNPFDQFTLGYIQQHYSPNKEDAGDKKKKLVEFYDKASQSIDQGDILGAYKNFATENGSIDRVNYLEDQARSEVETKRRGLANTAQFVNKLQEDRRQAAIKGDMEEYGRLNDLIQAGVENIRQNKDAAEAGLRTESGLRLHEEALNFASEMLNAKMEDL